MNCLLSIDLNTTRLNNQSYLHLLTTISCNSLEIHIYNFIEQKHNKLMFTHGEIIHPYSGSRKKVALDIAQALDIIEQCTKINYDNVYILCGEFESDYLFNKLNSMNINYSKVLQSTLRQIDTNQQTDITFESSGNSYEIKKAKIQNNDLITNNENQFNQSTTEHSYSSSLINSNDISTYSQKQQNSYTKLTPEQIKKIYTYIKFKRMQRELKLQ